MPGHRRERKGLQSSGCGKNATNLKSHLAKYHSEIFNKMMETENERKTSAKRKFDELGKYLLCRIIFLLL